MSIDGTMGATANLIFVEDVTGSVTVNQLDGNIDLRARLFGGTISVGTLGSSGKIDIDGNVVVPAQIEVDNMYSGTGIGIHVHGSLNGSGGSQPLIWLGSSTDRRVLIDGSMKNANASGDEIYSTGTLGTYGAIAVDYDGYDATDSWKAGASIDINGGSAGNRVYGRTRRPSASGRFRSVRPT